MRFHKYLKTRRAYEDAVLLDGAPELSGAFTGDGVPRDLGGRPYEPLCWNHTDLFGVTA